MKKTKDKWEIKTLNKIIKENMQYYHFLRRIGHEQEADMVLKLTAHMIQLRKLETSLIPKDCSII